VFEVIRNRLRQGFATLRFPREPAPEFPDRFRGRPVRDPARCPDDCRRCRLSAPSSLLVEGSGERTELDLGACLFSPEETTACPAGAIAYTRDYRMAVRSREALLTPTGGGELALAQALDERSRRLFGRSLRLRSVVAGSCGGCEAELIALGNVVFDLARFGVQFVASPRHADGLVITGALNANMRQALRQTYDAVPPPKIVLAVGACALSGGPFRGSGEVAAGVGGDIPVDLWVPGCPPHPLTILDGVLRLLGALEHGGGER
jgi:Ni,Fe-hydrogenase III small subunit/formate hydrogenlyase subunit 6/NADH:ubiquinone oxidoreductase subunit I